MLNNALQAQVTVLERKLSDAEFASSRELAALKQRAETAEGSLDKLRSESTSDGSRHRDTVSSLKLRISELEGEASSLRRRLSEMEDVQRVQVRVVQ